MTQWVRKPEYVETVVIPNNEFGDHPMHDWPEIPDWLQKAFDDHLIRPRFGGEDYWYYDVIEGGRTYPGRPDDIIIRESNGVIRLIKYDTLVEQYNAVDAPPAEPEGTRVPVYLPRGRPWGPEATIGTATYDLKDRKLVISVDIFNDADARLMVVKQMLQGMLAVSFLYNDTPVE